MSTGQTLVPFSALNAEFPSANYAQPNTRNGHWVLDFDTTTQEAVFFSGVMPRNYAGGGITVYLTWVAASATTGTGGWDVAFERIGAAQLDIDADGFQAAQTVVAVNVDPTSGNTVVSSVAVSQVNTGNLVAGEAFRLRVRRDVASDTAVGDLELLTVELRET